MSVPLTPSADKNWITARWACLEESMAQSFTVILLLLQSTTRCRYRVYTKFLLTYTAIYRGNRKVLPLGITALQPQSHFHLGMPYITESVPLDVDISGGCPCPFLTIKCLFCYYCIDVTWRFCCFSNAIWSDVSIFPLKKKQNRYQSQHQNCLPGIQTAFYIMKCKFTVGEKALTLTIVGPCNAHMWQRIVADMSSREPDHLQLTQLMVIIQIWI